MGIYGFEGGLQQNIWVRMKGKEIIFDVVVEEDDSLFSLVDVFLIQIMKLLQK